MATVEKDKKAPEPAPAPAITEAAQKAKLEAAQAEAEKKAALKAAKEEAERALAELEKRKKELEAIAYADWGPGKAGRRKIVVPATPDGCDVPHINGIPIQGELNVTYDTFQQIMHMIANRAAQEDIQRKGYHKGVKVQNLTTGDVRFVDTYLLPNER